MVQAMTNDDQDTYINTGCLPHCNQMVYESKLTTDGAVGDHYGEDHQPVLIYTNDFFLIFRFTPYESQC
jgi:hypothetical protein